MSGRSEDVPATQLAEAAEWLQRLHDSPGDEKLLGEWLKWCSADPGNLEAFDRIQNVWGAFDAPEIRCAANRVRASGASGSQRGWHWRSPRLVRTAAAASVLLAIGVAFVFSFPWRASDSSASNVLRTSVAKQGSQFLADGSRVQLGARTSIVTRYSEAERLVVVEAGEALFEVVKDPERPFVVEAGAVRVTAVGTAFSVRRAPDRTIVAVSEGVVRVAPRSPADEAMEGNDRRLHQVRLSAGEQVSFTESTYSIDITPIDPRVAVARLEGALSYVNEPLSAVVADVNRYAHTPIVIADPALAQRTFTGTVYGDRIDDWLLALREVFPLEIVQKEKTVEIVARESASGRSESPAVSRD
ncbi:MAG TPA: FecR domain-containing protein [Steroidobacteraceae bacterium]